MNFFPLPIHMKKATGFKTKLWQKYWMVRINFSVEFCPLLSNLNSTLKSNIEEGKRENLFTALWS